MSTILLKNEITQADLAAFERWMNNAAVTRYLNEHRQISAHLRAVREARLPVLMPLFNRDGRFWMICADDAPVGFLRAVYRPDNAAELVVAIGEETMWGRGFGRRGVQEGLQRVFFEMRREEAVVHIARGNVRSERHFIMEKRCGGEVPLRRNGSVQVILVKRRLIKKTWSRMRKAAPLKNAGE